MFELLLLSFSLFLFYLLLFFVCLFAFPDFFVFRTHPTPPPATLNASLKNFNWLVSWTRYFVCMFVIQQNEHAMRTLIPQLNTSVK
mgnify:FL=1